MSGRPEPAAGSDLIRGLQIHWWDWPAAAAEPVRTAFLIHATGFHGRVWDQIVRRLPADWRCIALEVRGHGRSEIPPDPDGFSWHEMASDVVAFFNDHDLRHVIAVGHSMGGCVTAMASAEMPDRIDALLLADPVIRDAELIGKPGLQGPPAKPGEKSGPNLVELSRKRRRLWPSAQAMFDSFADRGPFAGWDRRVLHDYCDYGLVSEGDEWALATEPESEARTFEQAAQTDPWPALRRLTQPLVVLRAGLSGGTQSTTSKQLAGLPTATVKLIEDSDHFIPMRRPDLIAREIKSLSP